ncbi:hypothetical protein MNV49_002873 [Pseudohyphozyma bogoriensis]|nr:hypothetical protein MNV49_002873 [Pseudohyphozyma bogoriensis]
MAFAPDALATCQTYTDALLSHLNATRITLRTQPSYPQDGPYPVLVESLDPTSGASTLLGNTSIDVRDTATFLACGREGKGLIQDDIRGSAEAMRPPEELIVAYGVVAQLLCPIFIGDAVVGVVSVHEAKGVRQWTDEDTAFLVEKVKAMSDALGLGGEVRNEFFKA